MFYFYDKVRVIRKYELFQNSIRTDRSRCGGARVVRSARAPAARERLDQCGVWRAASERQRCAPLHWTSRRTSRGGARRRLSSHQLQDWQSDRHPYALQI